MASLVAMLVLGAIDADGPIWLLQGVLAVAAAVMGWSARTDGKLQGRALAAVVLGALLFIAFIVGTISEFA